MVPWVDSHCHLHLLPDQDTEAVLARARAQGVGYFLNITITEQDVSTVQRASEKYDGVFCSVGIHPCEADRAAHITTENIVSWTRHPRVIAIGESGLDFFRGRENAKLQEQLFLRHIYAAQETGITLVIHSRAAEPELLRILKREMQSKKFSAVLHCFTGSEYMAEEALALGFSLGVTGIITFPRNNAQLINIFKTTPLERLLVETDCPYLAPVPKRGQPNEPAFVTYTAQKLAELLDATPNQLAHQTTTNFSRLFQVSLTR